MPVSKNEHGAYYVDEYRQLADQQANAAQLSGTVTTVRRVARPAVYSREHMQQLAVTRAQQFPNGMTESFLGMPNMVVGDEV